MSEASEAKRFEVPEVPRDEDGFVVSFSVDDEEQYSAFFSKFGFVVIRDVLSPLECENTIQDIWLELEAVRTKSNPDRNDPRTWERWPGLPRLGLFHQAKTHFAWKNRLNPSLRRVYRKLLGLDELWVSVDNFGVLRPTKAVPMGPLPFTPTRTSVEDKTFDDDSEEYEVRDREEWGSTPKWLHWDLNPWEWLRGYGTQYRFDNFISENNGSMRLNGELKVQGLLNLIDAREQDGGFMTVPGFCHHLEEFCKQDVYDKYRLGCENSYDFVYVPPKDPMHEQCNCIHPEHTDTANHSACWLFDCLEHEQPHCNFANSSDRFRMVQYVKCFRAPTPQTTEYYSMSLRARLNSMRYVLNSGLSPQDQKELSLDDRRLIGLTPYEGVEDEQEEQQEEAE